MTGDSQAELVVLIGLIPDTKVSDRDLKTSLNMRDTRLLSQNQLHPSNALTCSKSWTRRLSGNVWRAENLQTDSRIQTRQSEQR